MKNIFDYLKEHGKYTFKEEKFNEVDGCIFSLLSYVDFTGIVPSNKSKVKLVNAITYFLNYCDLKEYYKKGFIQKELVKLCEKIVNCKRYRDIELFSYYSNITFNSQFCAISISLPDGKTIISYEGTDENLVSWEEDLALSYKFPVPAEKEAVKYINKNVGLFTGDVYVVGHSKGGHMAVVASMFANPIVKMKIKKVYNYDGPGLRKEQYLSKKFTNLLPKLEHIVPNYSVVGLLMYNGPVKSIRSSRMDIYAHSPFNWEVVDTTFLLVPLSKLSRSLDESVIMWLEKHDDATKERIVKDLFDFLRKSGIKRFTEITKIGKVIDMFKNHDELDIETKNLLSNFVKFNLTYAINKFKD